MRRNTISIVIVSLPWTSHVIPLLELANRLAQQGIKVTFVKTDIISIDTLNVVEDGIHLVSIPDGLESEERRIPGKLMETLYTDMPGKIEELLHGMKDEIACIVYDQTLGSIQQVATKMGVRSATFVPSSAASLVLSFSIPKLIQDGIIDDQQGMPLKNEVVQFGIGMPAIRPLDFVWNRLMNPIMQKVIFNIMQENNRLITSVDWIICNSVHVLEAGALAISPQILPIGPLVSSNSVPGFSWEEDIKWLDKQALRSVIYVAFGSMRVLDKGEIQELALGLELTGWPFLWVSQAAKSDFPEGFLERVRHGRVVKWVAQQRVLQHPSVACFISHCGWNSVVESVSSGVPLVCWPHVRVDQTMNQSYVCDVWRVGVRLEVVTRGEIAQKVEGVIREEGKIKERADQLRDMVWDCNSRSTNNFNDFVTWIKRE